MISILIPVYNEEKILRESVMHLFGYLTEHGTPFEVLVVDNGSTDQTLSLARSLEKEFNWFRVFSIPEKSVGQAFAKGVREARFPYVISLDADLSVDLSFIKQAERLLANAVMVVGSKTLGTQKRSLIRVLGSQIYLIVTQVLFQMTITDFSMGAKAYRKQAILPILGEIDFWTAYVFEICVWLNLNKQTMVQVGVSCIDHRKSRFNIWHEGYYRYQNLYRVWRKLKNRDSWYYRISPKAS
jgi:glycosyltransferase involved in cell wall biosynthesis